MNLPDTHLILLSAASQRDDGLLLLPANCNEERRRSLSRQLLKLGMVDEVFVNAGSACWCEELEERIGLKINAAGLAALGLEPCSNALTENAAAGAASEGKPSVASQSDCKPSKVSTILEMIHAAEGASIEELCMATGWLPHTVRAALSGLRKKLHTITLSPFASGRRAYCLTAPAANASVNDGAAAEKVR